MTTASLPETSASALPHVEPELTVRSTKTDDRRGKYYDRAVKLLVRVQVDSWDKHRTSVSQPHSWDGISPHHAIQEELQRARAGVEGHRTAVVFDGAGSWGDQGSATYGLRVTFKADKPSLIPSEEDCVAELGGADAALAMLTGAIERGLAEAERQRELYRLVADGNHLLATYVEFADSRAAAVVRYKQRLAALNAEYVAEVKEQAAHLFDGDDAPVPAADYQPDERAIEVARAELPKAAAKLLAPSDRWGFGRCTNHEGPITAQHFGEPAKEED